MWKLLSNLVCTIICIDDIMYTSFIIEKNEAIQYILINEFSRFCLYLDGAYAWCFAKNVIQLKHKNICLYVYVCYKLSSESMSNWHLSYIDIKVVRLRCF